MDLGDGLGELTYSTLVHPGDTWEEMRTSLREFVPAVKARVSPHRSFGVSLRLSAASAHALVDDDAELEATCAFLDENDLYVFTVNAFPYGPFKGRRVKEQVYEPDWSTTDRASYTCAVADVLTRITSEHVEPTIQTAPLAFRPNVSGADYVGAMTGHLLDVVAHLVDVERRTGRRVKLALEPEPACFLETTAETVDYFEQTVYSPGIVRALAAKAGIAVSEAIGALRRHLGVVFDICHQAVGFEDIPSSLALLEGAGIPVFKLQEAAALWMPDVTDDTVQALSTFTDTIYLSQTTQLKDDVLTEFLNLEDAIAAREADPGPREWRTHFHVPVFLDDLGPFRTTRFAIEQALAVHARSPQSNHLEIETYTWDVLPEHLKTGDVVDYVSRELEWVRETALREAGAGQRARGRRQSGVDDRESVSVRQGSPTRR